MTIQEIRIVEKELVRILSIFLDEFIEYVPVEKRRYFVELMKIKKTNQLIGFDSGMGAWCKDNKIYFAVKNNEVFKKLAQSSDYGKRKDIKLVAEHNFINNDKDYIDYMEYFIGNGMKEIDYCLDVLPHEVMHLIGSSGGILGEGITELRSRQVCKKYGIRCAPIMHSKETKLAIKLEKYVGEIALNEASFFGDFTILEERLGKIFGEEAFKEVYEELRIGYRQYVSNRSTNLIEHYKKYRDIDFSRIYALVDAKDKLEIE